MAHKGRTPKSDWAPAFLEAFAEHKTVVATCRAVGVGRTTFYERRQSDENFALAFADLEEFTTEQLEREAMRRAAEGVERAVYHQGEVVGSEKHFSDTLLIFMLKARRPEVYRENVRVEHSGGVRHELVQIPTDTARRTEVLALLQQSGVVDGGSS